METSLRLTPQPLTRTLTASETWGFGLTSLSIWIGLVAGMHAELGASAIAVWIPSAIVGFLLNYQVKRLGKSMPDVAGGTPNYMTRLLSRYPAIATYGAIGYALSWISAISVNAVLLTDLIAVNFANYGIECPTQWFRIGFTVLPFVVAFSGSRALSILHLFFVVPAVGLLLLFGLQGLGWLAFSPNSSGFFPSDWGNSLTFVSWAKWFFLSTYATYASETASSFVADSQDAKGSLKILPIAAWLSLPVFIGGSWVVGQIVRQPDLKDSVFSHLVAASSPFWGDIAPLIVTFLIASAALLAQATAVSNSPRIFYQLAIDEHLSPIFSVVSRRGVFGAALSLTLGFALFFLIWDNVSQIIVWGNVAWLISFILLHLGFWLKRDESEILFPRLSLGIFGLEIVVLFVGGCAWGWQNFLGGLLLPLSVMAIDAAIRRIDVPAFRPEWWLRFDRTHSQIRHDSILFQVSVLIGLLAGSVLIGWGVRAALDAGNSQAGSQLILVLVMVVIFVGVAIACWTTLPQVVAISEARETAESMQAQLQQRTEELEAALQDLQQAQLQIVQSEKMSALGNLVAGVAHEINNPIGFIAGNLSPAIHYVQDLFGLIDLYQETFPKPGRKIEEEIEEIDLEYVREDLPKLIDSMKEGVTRIKSISSSLRVFSRADRDEKVTFNLNEGIDSTLLILKHRLKANEQRTEIEIIKDYTTFLNAECFPGQLNQVFMNILGNAIDALDESNQNDSNHILIQTLQETDQAVVRIRDNGVGMSESVKSKIFEHLFTTKAVGKGTGLGLAIARQIVVEKHGGTLEVESEPGRGTEFIIRIPMKA